ncbi:MAG: photosystem II core protein PsbZ [Richelia sp. SM2_1_7]|nr:photosystem II core protein PsbZ [Richelia sp. SM2_1_7]
MTPLIGIIMGSDSDLPTMDAAIAICAEFGVTTEVAIVSAHRTPHRMVEYAQSAVSRGIKVIIAGAGGAAHLPGMVAALTPLPVIGVPVAYASPQNWDQSKRLILLGSVLWLGLVLLVGGLNYFVA